MNTRSDTAKDALRLQWGTVRLTSGFYLSDLVRSTVQFADGEVATKAIRQVCNLLDAGCTDEREWRAAIDKLGELCRAHPDAYKQSGTWYHGAASLMALAVAKEAAIAASFKLYPTLHSEAEVEGRVYKAFKYLLRAMVQKPESATTCLSWIEQVVDLQPSRG